MDNERDQTNKQTKKQSSKQTKTADINEYQRERKKINEVNKKKRGKECKVRSNIRATDKNEQ